MSYSFNKYSGTYYVPATFSPGKNSNHLVYPPEHLTAQLTDEKTKAEREK